MAATVFYFDKENCATALASHRAAILFNMSNPKKVSINLLSEDDVQNYEVSDNKELLGLKESRTKDILKGLSDRIEIIGSNRDRRYKKK